MSTNLPIAFGSRVSAGMFTTAAVVVLGAVPFLVSDYAVSQINQYLFLALAVLGLNVLSGFSGQLSIGHGAFLAIGAYVSVVLVNHLGLHYLLTIPVAAFVCFVAGLLIGFPALRLSGHYLALATFALSLALPQMLKYKPLEAWTGGVQGILIPPPEVPAAFAKAGIVLEVDRWFYFVTLLIVVAVYVLVWNMLRGRVGRGLVAIRDHSIAAATMGVNVGAYKAVTFGISAAITGIAGSLTAISTGFVAPDSFTVMVSISLLVGSVIGGISSVIGAPFGALFIHFLPEFAQNISNSAPSAVYGALLLFVVYVMPGGVAGLIRALTAGRMARRRPGVSDAARISALTKRGDT